MTAVTPPMAAPPEHAEMSQVPAIFDRRAVRRHRDRAAEAAAAVAPIFAETAARLLDRLDDTTRRFHRALEIGGRGQIGPALRARGLHVVSQDLSPRLAAQAGGVPLAADEEHLPFAPASFDLVISHLALHWTNDLPGALIQLRRALAPDGLFLACLPIEGTLDELRMALITAEAALGAGVAPRMSPLAGLQDCAGLLQRAGFALPVADAEDITLDYADARALLADLRAAGETCALHARSRRTPPAGLFAAVLAALPARQERVPVRLRLAMLTGWAPSPAQPQPKPRGSATVSLAAALADPRQAGTGDRD